MKHYKKYYGEMDSKLVTPYTAYEIWMKTPVSEPLARVLELKEWFDRNNEDGTFDGYSYEVMLLSYIWNSGRVQGLREERMHRYGTISPYDAYVNHGGGGARLLDIAQLDTFVDSSKQMIVKVKDLKAVTE